MDTWDEIERALQAVEERLPVLMAEYPDEGDVRDAFHHQVEPILERAEALDHGRLAAMYAVDILIRAGLVDPSERIT